MSFCSIAANAGLQQGDVVAQVRRTHDAAVYFPQ
jgi:hypothetical protein